jgi:hypothetical protein
VSLDPSNPNIQDRWVVAPEIFWKARGDHLEFTEAAIACVFKKFMSRLPDGRPLARTVERSAQSANQVEKPKMNG